MFQDDQLDTDILSFLLSSSFESATEIPTREKNAHFCENTESNSEIERWIIPSREREPEVVQDKKAYSKCMLFFSSVKKKSIFSYSSTPGKQEGQPVILATHLHFPSYVCSAQSLKESNSKGTETNLPHKSKQQTLKKNSANTRGNRKQRACCNALYSVLPTSILLAH